MLKVTQIVQLLGLATRLNNPGRLANILTEANNMENLKKLTSHLCEVNYRFEDAIKNIEAEQNISRGIKSYTEASEILEQVTSSENSSTALSPLRLVHDIVTKNIANNSNIIQEIYQNAKEASFGLREACHENERNLPNAKEAIMKVTPNLVNIAKLINADMVLEKNPSNSVSNAKALPSQQQSLQIG